MKEKKAASRVSMALFLMALVTNAVEIAARELAYYYFPSVYQSRWFPVGLIALGFYICGYPVFVLMTSKIPDCKTRFYTRKPYAKTMFEIFCMCMFMGYVFNFAGTALSYFVSTLTGVESLNPIEVISEASGTLPMMIVAGVLSPIFEELVFRKTVLRKTLVFGEKPAVWFTAVTFALLHMNLYQFMYALAIGVVMGYLTVKTGSVKYSVILHIMINMTGSVIMPVLFGMGQTGYMIINVLLVFIFIMGPLWILRGRLRPLTEKCPVLYSEEETLQDEGGFYQAAEDFEEKMPVKAGDLYINWGFALYLMLCILGFIWSVM